VFVLFSRLSGIRVLSGLLSGTIFITMELYFEPPGFKDFISGKSKAMT